MKNKVPKLRFPEFSGEWEEKKFHSIFKIFNGYAFSSSDSRSNGIRWVKIADVGIKKMKEDSLSFLPFDYKKKYSNFLLNENDYVLALTRPILNNQLKIAKVNSNFHNSLLNQRVGKLESNQNIDFVYQLLQRNNIVSKIEVNIAGSDPPNLSPKEINNLKTNIPSLPEQEKIASFLLEVDTKIEKLEKKKELLSQYKKGMMQKLFSQKLRFKDENGNDYPEWEEKKLGEIGFFQTSSVDKLYIEGENEVKLVNYMNVYRHEKIDNNAIKNYQIVTAKNSQIQTSNLLRGDILFTPSSETPEDIGHSVVIFENLEKCVFSYHLMRFRPNIELDILYSHYFCNNKNVLNQIIRLATGSTRFTISVKSFSSIKILLPAILEQEKIANFLSSIDRKIELIVRELEKNKEFKKGLLQNMFV